jgi:hypothetical protein
VHLVGKLKTHALIAPMPSAQQLIDHFGLEPLPVEGGLFRQTWRAPVANAEDKPAGTCIMAMFTAEADSFSAMHRLPTAEIWHFYLGDAIELLLLHANGKSERIALGQDVLRGQRVQFVVPAGAWMGAHLLPGGSYALFGCTMAPGFTSPDYEGGEREALIARYPAEAQLIAKLTRLHAPTSRMPDGL